MSSTRLAVALAMTAGVATVPAGAVPVQATPAKTTMTRYSVAQVCYGGETNGVERRIDTMLVKLDISHGLLKGYWVQYGDDVALEPGTRKIDAVPVFIALPPNPEEHPGPYRLDYKESFAFGTTSYSTTPDAAVPDVLTYRDLKDWPISEGSTGTIEGRIFGNMGNFSSCSFVWTF